MGDLLPALRGGNDLHSPARGGLPFDDPLSAIGDTARGAGGDILSMILGLVDPTALLNSLDPAALVAALDPAALIDLVTGLLDPQALLDLLDPTALVDLVMGALDPETLLGLLDPTAIVDKLDPAALIAKVEELLNPETIMGLIDPATLLGLFDPASLVAALDPTALIDLVMGLLDPATLLGLFDPTALVGALDPTALLDMVMGLLDPAAIVDMVSGAIGIDLGDLGGAFDGIDISDPGSILAAIIANAGDPIGLINALTGLALPAGTANPLDYLGTFGTNLGSLFPGSDLNSGAFNPTAALSNFVTLGLKPLDLLLGKGDAIPGGDIVGSLLPQVLGLVPFTSLGDILANLVPDPTFQDAGSINAADGWGWNGALGKTTAGVAQATANGTLRELLSDPATAVSAGQVVPFSVFATWTNLVGGTLPVGLSVATYDPAGAFIANVPLANIGAAGTQAAWQPLTGSYTVPAGVGFVRQRLTVAATATSGTVNFDDADHHKTQLLPQSWTAGLPGALTGLADQAQATINGLFEGLFGGAPSGAVGMADIIHGLQNIPPTNVMGLQGGTIADTFQGTVDTLWGGFAKLFGQQGKSIFDVASLTSDTVTTADTSLQVGEWNNALLGVRNNKSLMEGMDETEESNFLLTDLFSGGADPSAVIAATAGSYPVAYWRAKELAKKGVISWFGKGFAGVTNLFIDIYKLNYVNSTSELLHSSSDQIGQVTAAWSLCRYTMPSNLRFDVTNGDVIGVCWRVVGAGTHSVAGKAAGSWLPNHPTVVPAKPAATRTTVGTLAFNAIVYSNNVPWFGIGIAAGDDAPDYHAPRTTPITDVGAFSYAVPDWADEVDEIMVGASGGGHGGNNVFGQTGEGGHSGTFTGRTLRRGIELPTTPGLVLTGIIGTGGVRGAVNGNGGSGTSTTRNAIAGGDVQRSAAGGAGGTHYDNEGFGDKYGDSPGNFDFNGATYPGGGIASGGNTANGAAGQPPGGGGGGGGGGTWGIAWVGGAGARGGAWYVARQVP